MFTIRGRADGAEVTVTWADGQLTGDPVVRLQVAAAIDRRDEVALTPTGPWERASLDEDLVALATILEAFDEALELTGDVPAPPPEPELGDTVGPADY